MDFLLYCDLLTICSCSVTESVLFEGNRDLCVFLRIFSVANNENYGVKAVGQDLLNGAP